MTEAGPKPSDDAVLQSSTAAPGAESTADAPTTASAAPVTYYYQYCFHLSPTFNKWCPMRVSDILRLDQFDAFEGQNVYFHQNHPIKWVRIAGVVVSFADYNGRHVYVVDDGSGASIECVLLAMRPRPAARKAVLPKKAAESTASDEAKEAPVLAGVGSVVEVRGELNLYKFFHNGSIIQIQVTKLTVLRGTQQEVQFWHKVNTFARSTLDRPWVLDKPTVRACRKAAYAWRKEADAKKPAKPSANSRALRGDNQATARKGGKAAQAPRSPPRQPKNKWQISADPPGQPDLGCLDEPTEPDEQPPRLPASHRLIPVHATGPAQHSRIKPGHHRDAGVHITAEAAPRRKPPKKWDIG